MGWYGVRSIFHFGIKNDGTNVFEERVVVFEAKSEDEAFQKAEIESTEYARWGGDDREDMEIHPHMELYIQDGDRLIDGYEVWSQLFEATESLDEFFQNRYARYKYKPDEEKN